MARSIGRGQKTKKECFFQAMIIIILGRLTVQLFVRTTTPAQETGTMKKQTRQKTKIIYIKDLDMPQWNLISCKSENVDVTKRLNDI